MRRLWICGALLAAGLAVSACKGDDKDENDGTGSDGEPDGKLADSSGASTSSAPSMTTGGVPLDDPDPRYDLAPWPDEGAGFDECTAETQMPEPYNVVLMFVVDVSGSMNQPAPGTKMSKWEATREALRETISTLPPQVAMGVVYFPNMPEPGPLEHTEPTDDLSECVAVDAMVEPDVVGDDDSDHREALEDSLEDKNVNVYGGTPTHAAYAVGRAALEDSELPGNKYVVLLTDGEPTYGQGCVGNGTTLEYNMDPAYIEDTLDAIEGAYEDSRPPIGTFVIGSPGSEKNYSGADARPWLSEAARRGHTDPVDCDDDGPDYCHFDLSDPDADFARGLNDALGQILGQVVACEYSPPEPPADQTLDTDLVSVKFIDGSRDEFYVPLVSEDNCDDGMQGWYWADEDTLRLCPETCGLVQADALAGIAVAYGCERELT